MSPSVLKNLAQSVGSWDWWELEEEINSDTGFFWGKTSDLIVRFGHMHLLIDHLNELEAAAEESNLQWPLEFLFHFSCDPDQKFLWQLAKTRGLHNTLRNMVPKELPNRPSNANLKTIKSERNLRNPVPIAIVKAVTSHPLFPMGLLPIRQNWCLPYILLPLDRTRDPESAHGFPGLQPPSRTNTFHR